jgi:hypothetical protein
MMNELLSRATSPTALLYVFLFITQVANGLYVARQTQPPEAYTLLYPLAFLWIIGWWLLKDSRRRGVGWVFDMGLFLYIAWPFFMPYYLFKTRGSRALVTILIFVGVYLGALMLGVFCYVLLTP